MKKDLLALCGAVVGGVLGYFVFFWLASQGFYGMLLPGALLGLGAAVCKNRAVWVAVVCGLAGLALGVFTEFRYAPFERDDSFSFFLTHLHHKRPLKLLLIGLGALLGFWISFPRQPREL
jgi:hypothetical protein